MENRKMYTMWQKFKEGAPINSNSDPGCDPRVSDLECYSQNAQAGTESTPSSSQNSVYNESSLGYRTIDDGRQVRHQLAATSPVQKGIVAVGSLEQGLQQGLNLGKDWTEQRLTPPSENPDREIRDPAGEQISPREASHIIGIDFDFSAKFRKQGANSSSSISDRSDSLGHSSSSTPCYASRDPDDYARSSGSSSSTHGGSSQGSLSFQIIPSVNASEAYRLTETIREALVPSSGQASGGIASSFKLVRDANAPSDPAEGEPALHPGRQPFYPSQLAAASQSCPRAFGRSFSDVVDVKEPPPIPDPGSVSAEFYLPSVRTWGYSSSMKGKAPIDRNSSLRARVAAEPLMEGDEVYNILEVLDKAISESRDPGGLAPAAAMLRRLSKQSQETRQHLVEAGAVPVLMTLLGSNNRHSVESGVIVLLNLSLEDGARAALVGEGAIEKLVCLLGEDFPITVRENSAAALASLAEGPSQRHLAASLGSVPRLVALLWQPSIGGRKDATRALIALSLENDLRELILSEGVVNALLEAAAQGGDESSKDKYVALLQVLAKSAGGSQQIMDGGGLTFLVDTLEGGSQRGREDACACLLNMSAFGPNFVRSILNEGAIPSLIALGKSVRPRARTKALSLLKVLRGHRSTDHNHPVLLKSPP